MKKRAKEAKKKKCYYWKITTYLHEIDIIFNNMLSKKGINQELAHSYSGLG